MSSVIIYTELGSNYMKESMAIGVKSLYSSTNRNRLSLVKYHL